MSNAQTMPAEITVTAPLVQSGTVMTPMAMIDRALASGATPETLEKLMALQERWEAGEARREYNEAMTAAKAEIKPIIKNRHAGFESKRTGDRTDYDYEDLPMVASTVDPILTRYGLSYHYASQVDNGQVFVTCIVTHRRGHHEETTLPAPIDTSGSKNAVQAIGSTITYLQRYTLKLALGLSAAKDDDARASGNPELALDITSEQRRELLQLLTDSGSKEGDMLAYVKADDISTMTLAQYAKAKQAMVVKIKRKAGK